jgi:hypothetical protein
MQFGDFALSKSEEADVGVTQSLIDCGNILLIATNAIESLGNDMIKGARLSLVKKRLHARSVTDTAAADGIVCIDIDDCAVLLLNAFSAEADLILDRGCGLKFR